MHVRRKLASRSVIVIVVVAMCASAIAETGTPPTADKKPVAPIPPEVNNQIARSQRLQDLTVELTEKHGYKLDKNEPFKYISNGESETRSVLRYVLKNNENWSTPPKEYPFGPFTLVFQADTQGRLVESTLHENIITLGDVFTYMLKFMPYEYDCPPGLLTTYVPGDWIFLLKPDPEQHLNESQLEAFEKILNEQLNLGVRVAWRDFERPAIVIRGTYKAAPKERIPDNGQFDPGWEGMFVINARRAVSYHPESIDGDFEAFKKNLSYLFMLPVVDETKSRPLKKTLVWNETGKPIEGEERLPVEHEERVLKSLHDQMGYDFRVEPREVKLLSIQPVDE